jgi:CDGSH-type Zn-finger protein
MLCGAGSRQVQKLSYPHSVGREVLLSVGISGVAHRPQAAEQKRLITVIGRGSGYSVGVGNSEVVIVPYRDGPYLVRGPVILRDQDGASIELTRRTIALCRCGRSRMRPFCDGSHQLIRFRSSSAPEDRFASAPGEGHGNGTMPKSTPNEASGLLGASTQLSQRTKTELLRARQSVTQLLHGPHPSSPRGALQAAQPLVAAAARLLEEELETQLPQGYEGERRLTRLIAQLSGASTALKQESQKS